MKCWLLLVLAVPLSAEDGGWIDVHVHMDGKLKDQADFEGTCKTAIDAMGEYGIERCLVMPPPQPPNHPNAYDCDAFAKTLQAQRKRFAFLGGGGTLNPMIQAAVAAGRVTDADRRKFEEKAEEILRLGAKGFGEMAAEHLSFFDGHPYESAPPDHPLFLLLADIAARHDVPIDLHMDPVSEEEAIPSKFKVPPNPPRLKANVAALERLLEHNSKAKVVWAHAGNDQTGQATVEMYHGMLERHTNLYLSVKINMSGSTENSPLMPPGRVKPAWLALVKDFPDRILLGSDTFYGSPKIQIPGKRMPVQGSLRPVKLFLDSLPEDLGKKIGRENALRLYHLEE